MSAGPLVIEIILTFIVAASVLYRYGNWYHHHIIVTISVLIAWYFSMLIVFVLPLDISNTVYEKCLNEHILEFHPNATSIDEHESNNPVHENETENHIFECQKPRSYVPSGVFPIFWRVVYWTSQVLTWLLLPLMQSYTKAGDFSFAGKLRSALVDNIIYYGSYLLIVAILLIYLALRPDVYLDATKLKTIAATASNTWGLFWLVLLLGYGLVEVPRSMWHSASIHHTLKQAYFKVAKLVHEKAEVDDNLNDLLHSMSALRDGMTPNHSLRTCMDTIESKIPADLLDKMRQMQPPDSPHADVPSEKALVRLHKQLLKALQHHNRIDTQWALLVDRVLELENAFHCSVSHDHRFHHSYPVQRSSLIYKLYTPTIEWYWKCCISGWLLRIMAVVTGILSFAVVWSELTFFVKTPNLSIFSVIFEAAQKHNDYTSFEILFSISMAYIALCAYSTLFKIRVLNLYYLAPHQQTDEYSLIFSGMMLCRLTPPMCLNFLSLIHMDSHVIEDQTEETHYTQIMGHMDVIPIISDGFNIYFPMVILSLCLATYYNLGSRLLSALGFQQFIGDDDLTSDLVDEGKTIMSREARKRQRMETTSRRRKELTQRFGDGESSASSLYRSARQRAEKLIRPINISDRDSGEGAQLQLLGETQQSLGDSDSMSSRTSTFNHNYEDYFHSKAPAWGSKPDKGLFDDV